MLWIKFSLRLWSSHRCTRHLWCISFMFSFFSLLSLFKIYGLTRFAAVCFTMTWTREKLHVNVVTELYRPFWKGVLFRVCLSDLSNFQKKGRKCHYNIIKSQIGKRILVDTIFLSFESMQSLSKIQNVGKRSLFRCLINSWRE